jgi:uncharacterized protein with ParB-like and HNH nuclease domain
MTNSNLIYSVNELFSEYLISEYKYYNIPEYQRGYKWTKTNVEELLEDIRDADCKGDKFYCLQNITIIPQENDKKELFFNVIDGQQRLTTLVILLSYLEQQALVKGKINYSIREETHKFLTDFILTRKLWAEKQLTYDDFIKANPHYNKPDIFFIFHTAKNIAKWFEKNTIDSEKLLNKVKFIVNQLPQKDNKEEEIFRNLNSDRVPLDGADLARGIIITRVARELIQSDELKSAKNIVAMNEKRVKVGLELDSWNNWWNQENVKNYFDFFKNKDEQLLKNNRTSFDIKQYPINQLYLLYAYSIGKELDLSIFEKGQDNNGKSGDDTIEMYKAIQNLHYTLQDWYKDKEIYHYLGYLFSQFGLEFKEVWTKWKDNNISRSEFKQELKNWIKKRLFSSHDNNSETDEYESWLEQIKNVQHNWYEEEGKKLDEILILLDIIELLKEGTSFLPPKYFKKHEEDKEHILPQTPNDEDIKKLDEYSKPQAIDHLKQGLNSIGNIVLLPSLLNQSYGNKPYLDKRFSILRDNIKSDEYIRRHTLNTFIQSSKKDQIDEWNLESIRHNAKDIAEKIINFFNNKES